MSPRDQPTPPFNSPYQQAMKTTTLLHSPAYPSPARSDSESSRYPTDGLGLYNYSQSFPVSGPPAGSVLYPPSPQPTESWTHLTTGTSPLMSEAPADPWPVTTYEPPVSRSPLPWAPHHASHRSSLSSTRDISIFSRESSAHAYPQIKLEGGSEWATDEEPSSAQRHHPLTVSPDRLTTGIFPYDQAYESPPMPKFEVSPDDTFESREFQPMPFEGRPRSHRGSDSSTSITARTRLRRNPTTQENANFSCDVCGKLFQRSYNHKTHMEIHNPCRRKEHVCQYKDCDKQFVRRTDLDRHTNAVHRKLKIFKCGRCGAHFARKDTLRRHEEDGCPKRNEVLSRRTSMRTGPSARMPYYHPPQPDMYDTRSPPLFRDDCFPGSPIDYKL
ncbi:uncharacterized protein BDR25DRAFT_281769 [Lindgomyces ingoldianus]|uniref:Uncharacterized protein n=1 Tax=Lindgomyces ingoldianus TaxID=673940 RepID=A0ACB6R3G5_9PLEO|nr:uncharacterized protein BDR25DRAFT_281769 [Lindgomyces ingoldianus]KAF2473799.1 hypothetical protein BDR25DRAFT_281769 [Lindgomyces ingoldianus]